MWSHLPTPCSSDNAAQTAKLGTETKRMKFGHLFIAITALAGAIFMAASAPAHAQFSAAARGEVLVLQ